MTAQNTETVFGSVKKDRITYFANKNWFSGGVVEDLPTRHVTMIRLETRRNWFLGVVLVLAGLFAFASGDAGILVGLLLLAAAALILWGAPTVMVNTSGGDMRPAAGWPWQKGEAESFVRAVREAVFGDAPTSVAPAATPPPQPQSEERSLAERLSEAKSLLDSGAIDDGEYKDMKARILASQ
ncbi:SHOCT domain-containing protein [Brevundimonas sp.]|uniref:SHOCT domain-containing protein n=1 Tax=Brevundimonas sp. TaxID=1871086 RepID=UPI003F72E783